MEISKLKSLHCIVSIVILNAGQGQDNETFADSVSTAPDLVETAQTQLSKGASPAIALITMEIAVRNILGATYVYNANAAAAYQEGVREARLILKVNILDMLCILCMETTGECLAGHNIF